MIIGDHHIFHLTSSSAFSLHTRRWPAIGTLIELERQQHLNAMVRIVTAAAVVALLPDFVAAVGLLHRDVISCGDP